MEAGLLPIDVVPDFSDLQKVVESIPDNILKDTPEEEAAAEKEAEIWKGDKNFSTSYLIAIYFLFCTLYCLGSFNDILL